MRHLRLSPRAAGLATLWRRVPRTLRIGLRSRLSQARQARLALRSRLRRRSGVDPGREPPLVVTLTSIADRLDRLHLCLESLLSQTLEPSEVVLWLSQDLVVPRPVERLTRFGLTIRRAADLGPHTKLLHALERYPSSLLVTADDDVAYPPRWLEGLHRSYLEHAESIHCYRARLIAFDSSGELLPFARWELLTSAAPMGPDLRLFPTGVGGVLYPPGSLHPDVHDRAAFRSLCPTNDDIWFKAMALLDRRPACKVAGGFDTDRFLTLASSKRKELWAINRDTNERQVEATFSAYHLDEYLKQAAT